MSANTLGADVASLVATVGPKTAIALAALTLYAVHDTAERLPNKLKLCKLADAVADYQTSMS